MRAAAEEKKDDRAAYNEGYVEGQGGFVRLMPPIKLRRFHGDRRARQSVAPEPQRTIDAEAEAGTFMDDSDVDDDF